GDHLREHRIELGIKLRSHLLTQLLAVGSKVSGGKILQPLQLGASQLIVLILQHDIPGRFWLPAALGVLARLPGQYGGQDQADRQQPAGAAISDASLAIDLCTVFRTVLRAILHGNSRYSPLQGSLTTCDAVGAV